MTGALGLLTTGAVIGFLAGVFMTRAAALARLADMTARHEAEREATGRQQHWREEAIRRSMADPGELASSAELVARDAEDAERAARLAKMYGKVTSIRDARRAKGGMT